MARYTSTIEDILMMYLWQDGKEKDFMSMKEIIDYGMPKLFNFNYPLYDSKLKEQFQRDFIRHFYMREIGSESIALFKQRLEDYLVLTYPKWKKLYDGFEELNPFINYDVKTNRKIDEDEKGDKTNTRDDIKDSTHSNELTRGDKENLQRNTSKDNTIDYTSDTSVIGSATDFSRNIESNTPDERMELSAEDGRGLVPYASGIAENRGKSTSQNDTDVVDQTKTKETNTQTDVRTQNRDETSESMSHSTLDRDETEKRLRELQHVLEERKTGKIGNQSYTEMYEEFIQAYEGLHKQMFKEMSYLFMSVLN